MKSGEVEVKQKDKQTNKQTSKAKVASYRFECIGTVEPTHTNRYEYTVMTMRNARSTRSSPLLLHVRQTIHHTIHSSRTQHNRDTFFSFSFFFPFFHIVTQHIAGIIIRAVIIIFF